MLCTIFPFFLVVFCQRLFFSKWCVILWFFYLAFYPLRCVLGGIVSEAYMNDLFDSPLINTWKWLLFVEDILLESITTMRRVCYVLLRIHMKGCFWRVLFCGCCDQIQPLHAEITSLSLANLLNEFLLAYFLCLWGRMTGFIRDTRDALNFERLIIGNWSWNIFWNRTHWEI